MMKTYSQMITIPTFIERYRYLKLNGSVGEDTFGYNRYLNQILYRSKEWRSVRDRVIDRDKGCDLGCEGFDIFSRKNILIHHINPITLKDIQDRNPKVFDLDNLITTTLATHNAIHYGDESQLPLLITERGPNDTCPWK